MSAMDKRFHYKFDDRIQETREATLKLLQDVDPKLYYPQDADRVKQSDIYIRRHLEYHSGDVNRTAEKIIYTFKVLKSMGIRDIKDNFFPIETWLHQALFRYGSDKNGKPVIYMRGRYGHRFPRLKDIAVKFILHMLYKFELEMEEEWTVVVDNTGLRYLQADIETGYKVFYKFREVVPNNSGSVFIVNAPYFARCMLSVCSLVLPEQVRQRFRVIDAAELEQFIDKDQMPDFLGGTCLTPYEGLELVPKGSPPIDEFAMKEMAYTQKEAEKLKADVDAHLKSILN